MMTIRAKMMKSNMRIINSLLMKPSKNSINPTAMKINAIVPMMLSIITIRAIKKKNKVLFSIV